MPHDYALTQNLLYIQQDSDMLIRHAEPFELLGSTPAGYVFNARFG